MTIAVIDANVVAAAAATLHRPGSKPGTIVRRWFDGQFQVVLSAYILAETERTLGKRYFRSIPTADLHHGVVEQMRQRARMVSIHVVPGVAPHRHDDPVLATVAASEADWFVTGDAALLAMGSYAGVPFADPAGFLAALDAGAN